MSQEFTNKAWLQLFNKTMAQGDELQVRGSYIRERLNASITIDPMWPFITYVARNYNVAYCKKELQWKLYADRMDDRIENYASMWAQVKNDDGSFNSNYGHYWFKDDGVLTAVRQLLKDKHSRRATIPMLAREHVQLDVNDSVCTEAMTFLIRKDKLHCIVHMRSSDIVFGLGTDLPSFAMVMRIVRALILEHYPKVEMGYLTVTAASSHVYERHYGMYKQLEKTGCAVFPMRNEFWMPLISTKEAKYLINNVGRSVMISPDDHRAQFCRWLISNGEL